MKPRYISIIAALLLVIAMAGAVLNRMTVMTLADDETPKVHDDSATVARKAAADSGDGDLSAFTLDDADGPEGFVPTMMTDLQSADPTSGLQFIAPPTANNHGSATLDYPLLMPPARNGMQPQLSLQYSSDGGSGWLGEGWDIPIPAITVDTRWGVPRYDSDYESETYLLSGQMLAFADASGNMHVAHRGEPQLRGTDSLRHFFPRREGSFSTVTRHGTSPSDYWWEVWDNHGTRYVYGDTPNSRLTGTFTDASGNSRTVIAEWHLSEIKEIHGDYIRYTYRTSQEQVAGGLTAKALYLSTVEAGNANAKWPINKEALLFADDSNGDEEGPLDVAEIRFWDLPLSDAQAKRLGDVYKDADEYFVVQTPSVRLINENEFTISVKSNVPVYFELPEWIEAVDDQFVEGEKAYKFRTKDMDEPGRREDVIPCMKCMHCHDSNSTGKRYPSTCRMNPNTNHSFTEIMPEGGKPLPAETPRKVMVIGAGPAGLEAARVAAERGHSVSLYDNSDKLGGLLHFARGVKGDHEHFDDYLRYISHQLEKNKVDIHLFKTVTADLVKEEKPDAVIVAVGGKREQKLSGTDAVPVFSPTQAFGSEAKLGDTVAILGAGVQAVDFAAYLVTLGKKVVMIHSDSAIDIDKGQSGWFKKYIVPYLQAKGTKIWSQAEVLGIEDGGVKFITDTGSEKTVAVDSVVEFYNMVPNTELAEELESAGFEVHCAGDCADPHNIQQAVLSGNLAGRAV